jgi:CRISPR-associated exonuclease Cas4
MLSDFEERDFIPLSALNQYAYCPRRCYLIHAEGEFADNLHTQRGTAEHERVDTLQHNIKEGVRIEFALRLWSEKLGLSGRADVVEFHPDGQIYPVEYKHGKRQRWLNDDLQLAAQAICLEEMLGVTITEGAIYHQQSRRRREVVFNDELRNEVVSVSRKAHQLLKDGFMPKVTDQRQRCQGCSLVSICQPEWSDAEKRLQDIYDSLLQVKDEW